MFAREHRLRADKDVKKVLKLGRRFNAPECSFYVLPNRVGRPRVAVVASAGVSKLAVVRNRVKRQVRDVFRVAMERGAFVGGTDCVVVLRPPVVKIPDAVRQKFFESCVRRAHLFETRNLFETRRS